MSGVVISPITGSDADAVSNFLHDELNPHVAAEAWRALLVPPWADSGPNHGYQLHVDGQLAGVYAAVYSEREIDGAVRAVCNLAAFCVVEEQRRHSVRLIRALLKQREFLFTDLSPSGNVVPMNERLGFRRLDTSTRLTVNIPRWRVRGIHITEDPVALESVLRGQDAEVYADHRSAGAARHVLIRHGDTYAYFVFRVDSRKRLRLFATPLYAGGDRLLLETAWDLVRAHLLLRHGLPFTLAERRILGFAKGLGRELRRPRPRMIRGNGVDGSGVDYMYSELALVSW